MKDRKISWEVASTAIAVIVLLAVMFWANGLFDGEPAEEPAAASEVAPAPPAAEPAAEPQRRRAIPRPVITRTGGPEDVDDEDGATEGPDDAGDAELPALDDPFEPGDPAFVEAIKSAARDIGPDIEECMAGWWELDPTLSGRVQIEFVLGDAGLSEVTLLDHDDVPMGPLSCFGTAVYDGGWPAVGAETVVVFPFVFTPGDEG